MPRLSVVIPAYNNAKFIAETVNSVLAQSYRDFELIISDHESTDETRKVVERFEADRRVRITSISAGGGAERNWNYVTGLASGEFVKLVCGDDLLYPHAAERQIAALDDIGASVVMAGSSRDLIDARGGVLIKNLGLGGLRGRTDGHVAIRRSVLSGANIFGEPCCVTLRTDALAAVGGWHDDVGYHIDQATYTRVLLGGAFVAVPGPHAAFRISADQWSVSLAKQQAHSAALLHREIQRASPGLLSSADVVRGDAMATLRSFQRRAVYWYLGRRMHIADA